MEYNKQLEAQVKAKQAKKIQDHEKERELARKYQQEYIEKGDEREEKEFKERLTQNIQCVKMCETIEKTKKITS